MIAIHRDVLVAIPELDIKGKQAETVLSSKRRMLVYWDSHVDEHTSQEPDVNAPLDRVFLNYA